MCSFSSPLPSALILIQRYPLSLPSLPILLSLSIALMTFSILNALTLSFPIISLLFHSQ